jgi:nucleotide-binding universal stress UspA family protein
VQWSFSDCLIRTAVSLAASLDEHLICAFIDPASYLTEWEPIDTRTALSLDPTINEEAQFPSEQLRQRLEVLLGKPGDTWSFRVLNGDVPKSLIRLAENTGAALLVVGAGRPGGLAWLARGLEGSVFTGLIKQRHRPILVVPECGGPPQ